MQKVSSTSVDNVPQTVHIKHESKLNNIPAIQPGVFAMNMNNHSGQSVVNMNINNSPSSISDNTHMEGRRDIYQMNDTLNDSTDDSDVYDNGIVTKGNSRKTPTSPGNYGNGMSNGMSNV